MAYVIRELNDPRMISSGSTRYQVIKELIRLGYIDDEKELPTLPRFGKGIVIVRPVYSTRTSFRIDHI